MALVVSNAGELLLLSNCLNSTTTPENLTLKLYKTDVTPTATSVAADFTVCDFTGYSDLTLTRGSWTSPSTVSGNAETSYTATTFTNSGASQTVYGYYVVGATSGTLYWAEKFATSRTLNTSEALTLSPKFTLASQN